MTGTHILVFPFPAQGHMIPLLDFTDQIIRSHDAGEITITILVTPKNLPLLHQIMSVHPSIQTLVLPFPSTSSIPLGAENAKDLTNPISFLAMIRALGGLHDPLIKWFRSHPSPPVAILSDMFLGWTHRLAKDLGIRRIVFSPSGALALSVMNSMWREVPTRRDPNDQNEVVSFGDVPNCPEYPWWQLSALYRRYVGGDPDGEFLRDGFVDNLASWGLVVNTFDDLEGVYLKHLKKELGHSRVWAVGPVQPIEQSDPTTRGGSSSVSVDSIISWLDKCDDHKVVYVCFGSQAVLRNDQMEALALGLERSGVRFVWSIKEPTEAHVEGGYGRVPHGFEDRVAGRGLVIKGWAPQVLILSHRAVGAFLTHCGWNSVFESVTMGVPMLTWPLRADQFLNATLLVVQLKVAIRVWEGVQTVPDSVDLARVLVESVRDDDQALRQRATRLSEAALEATADGGSSVKDVESLIAHLTALDTTANK
ncbi:UDP-glycosyltransferase [Morus notabilis]|uniref:Glycosyltransferase n=1 Tax=Morus notabilis TaxID=981085 RepID=W9SJS0_9ROSA|nr:UDP-glycosyltransferase 89B2 [Morus notabilis]EXC32123.1 UDP-glycosyltransferase [Morus notabilis]